MTQIKVEKNIIDSLNNELEEKNIHDTTYINLLTEIGELRRIPRISYWDSIVTFSEKALESKPNKQTENRLLKSLANSSANISYFYSIRGDIPNAMEYAHKGLKIQKEISDKHGIANSLNNLGSLNEQKGNISKALECYYKSLKIGDKIVMPNTFNNLGRIYKNQEDFPKALEYFQKSFQKFEENGNEIEGCISLNNIGTIYRDQGNYSKALEYFNKSLKISQDRDFQVGKAYCFSNIGSTYSKQEKFSEALIYFHKSLKVFEEIVNKNGIAISLYKVGNAYSHQEQLKEALAYGLRCLSISTEMGNPINIKRASGLLSTVYEKQGTGLKALEMYKLNIKMKDSLNNEATQKATIRQQTKYEFEKVQAVKEKEHEKQLEVEQEAKSKQQVITYATSCGLGLVGIFLFFVMNRLKVTRKQKTVIEKQKGVVEEAHQEIKDSITYAKRIQSAILPPAKLVKEYLKESFILYKPKDVVAGDFYWMESVAPTSNNKETKVLYAAADCTGHGVPGAMVSVVCNNALNRSVREYGLTDVGAILDKTREIVIAEFEKSEEDVKDGMDIALCSVEGMKLQYAGAHNPLWIIRNGEIIETKANKQPIGQFDNPEPYTTHNFDLEQGDSIYVFSDGYIDQFGGEKGKKFKSKAFRELLLSIQDKSMEAQNTILDEAFETWRGNLEQIDDVCVIGVRV